MSIDSFWYFGFLVEDIISKKGGQCSFYAVTQDVTLPATAVWGGKVTWESSDAGLVSPQGKVTRPEQSCGVTLTATIQQGTLSIQKEFELWILKQEVEAQRRQITQEELLEWNPEGGAELLSDDGGETLSYIYGRFTPERVETEQEAVNAVWGVAGWMGADEETDDFKVYRRISHEDGTVFRMSQYYKGVRVFGGDVIVSTGEEGYADYLAAGFIKGIEAETEPVLDSEGIVQILKEAYKDVQLLGSELLLYNDGEGYKPAWSLDVIIEGIAYDVLAEDGTGKIIRMEDGIMYATPADISNADGSMMTSGAHLTDEDKENGAYAGYEGNYIAADLSRNIYVYVRISTGYYVPGDIVVEGRFSDKKIEDAYDARELGCSVMEYLGMSYDADTFLYWEQNFMYEIGSKYWFRQYYNGVRVDGGMSVWVEDGYVSKVRIHTVPQEEIDIEIMEPAFTKEDVLAYLDEHYKKCEVYECGLAANTEKGIWEWQVYFRTKDFDDYYIEFDGTTGEVLECLDLVGNYV